MLPVATRSPIGSCAHAGDGRLGYHLDVAQRYACPACGFLTMEEPPGSFDICAVCGWEDDPAQCADPQMGGGANVASLLEAQAEAQRQFPLGSATEFERDPSWRPLPQEELRPGEYDVAAAKRLILEKLPRHARWTVAGVSVAYEFSQLLGVARVSHDELIVFGSYDIADGGGAAPLLAIDRANGFVMGVDVEHDDEPVFLINSSLEQFIATFRYLDAFFGRGETLALDARDVVRSIDEAAYPRSEWRAMLTHTRVR